MKDSLKEKTKRKVVVGDQSITSDEERSLAPVARYQDVFSEDSSSFDSEADDSESDDADVSFKEADEDKENRECQVPSSAAKRQRDKSLDPSDQPARNKAKRGKAGVGNGSGVNSEGIRVFQIDWRVPDDDDEEYNEDGDFLVEEGAVHIPAYVKAAMKEMGLEDLRRKGGNQQEKMSRFDAFVEQIRNTEFPAYRSECKRLLKRIQASKWMDDEEVTRLKKQKKRFTNWSVDVMDAVKRRYDLSSEDVRLEIQHFDSELSQSLRTASALPDMDFFDGEESEDLSVDEEISERRWLMQAPEQNVRSKWTSDVLIRKRKEKIKGNPRKAVKRHGVQEPRGRRNKEKGVTDKSQATGKGGLPKGPRQSNGRREYVDFEREQESIYSYEEAGDDGGEGRNEERGTNYHEMFRPFKDSIFPTYVDDLGDEELERYYASLPRPPLGIDKVFEVEVEGVENLFGALRPINETWVGGGACTVIEALLKAMRLQVLRLIEKPNISMTEYSEVYRGLEAVSVHIRNYGHEYLSCEAAAFYATMKREVLALESEICPKGFSSKHCEGPCQSAFEIIVLWYIIDWFARLEDIVSTAWSPEGGPSDGVLYPLLKSVLLRLIRTYFALSTPRKSSVLSLIIEPDNFEGQPKELPMLGRLWFKVFREADAYLRGHGMQEGFWYLFSECIRVFNMDQEARCSSGSQVPQDKWVSLASFLRGSFERTEHLWKLVIELLRIKFMVGTRAGTKSQSVRIGCWVLLECLLSSSPFERGFQNLLPNREKAWMQARSDISMEAYKAAIIRRVEVFLLHWGGEGKLVLKLWEAGITDSCERLEKSHLPFQKDDEVGAVNNCYTWLLEKLKGGGLELSNLTNEGLHHLFWDVADPSRWLISASLLIPPPSLLQKLPHKDAISKIGNKGCDEVLFLLAWLASKQLELMERKDRKNFVMEVINRIKASAKEEGVAKKGGAEQYPMACLHNIILAILMLSKGNSAEDTLLVNVWRQLLIPDKDKYSQSQSMLAVQMLAYLYQDGENNASFFSIESILEKLLKCLSHEAARPKAELDENLKTIARDSIQRRWVIFFGILAITLLRQKAPIGQRNCPKFFQMIESFLQDSQSLDDATLAISLWAFRSFFPLPRAYLGDPSSFLLLLTSDQNKLPGPPVEKWPVDLPAAHYQQMIGANFLHPGKLVSSLSILFQKTCNSLKFIEQETGMINYGKHAVQILDCLAGMNLLLSSAGRFRDGFDVKTSLSCKVCFSEPGSVLRLFPACYYACAFQYAVPRSHFLQDEKSAANLVDTWLCLAMDPSIILIKNMTSASMTTAVCSKVQNFLAGDFWSFTRKLLSLLLQINGEFAYLFDLARVQEWLNQPIAFPEEEDAHLKEFRKMLSCRLVMLVNACRQLAKKAVGPPGSIDRRKAKELFDGMFLKWLHHVLEDKVKRSSVGQTALEKEKEKAYVEFFYAFAGMLIRILGDTVQQQQSGIALVEALFAGWIKKTEDLAQLSRLKPFSFRFSAFYLGDFVRFCALCRYNNGKPNEWVDQLIKRVFLQGFLPDSIRIEVFKALSVGLWSVWRPCPSPSSQLYEDSASVFSKISFSLRPSGNELGALQSNIQTKLETFRRQIIYDLNLAFNLRHSCSETFLNFLACFLSKNCCTSGCDVAISFKFDLLPILEPVMSFLASLLGSPETHLVLAASQVIQNLLKCQILESQRQVVDSHNYGPQPITELIKDFLEYLSDFVSLRKELVTKGYISKANQASAESLAQKKGKFETACKDPVEDKVEDWHAWTVKADGVKREDLGGASVLGAFTKERPLLFNQDTCSEESCLIDLEYLLVRKTYDDC